jgi:hypothetical protein
MDGQDELYKKSTATKVQMHEIKPASEGMSFGALLDKFYMNSELGKEIADDEKDQDTAAKDFVDSNKKSGSK